MSDLRRAGLLGLDVHRDVCGPAGGWCDRLDGDCRVCERLRGVELQWVCTFCVVGKNAWPGARRDELVSGCYTSGVCRRCGHERVMLLGVLPPT